MQTSSDDSEGDAKKTSVSDDEQPPQYLAEFPDTMAIRWRPTIAGLGSGFMMLQFVIDAKTNGLLTLSVRRNADSHIFAKLVEQFMVHMDIA